MWQTIVMPMRINKYLASKGYCSRREADVLIRDGRVLINGEKAKLGTQVEPTDDVRVEGKAQPVRQERVYYMLNKPVGLITTTDTSKPDNVVSHMHLDVRVFPVGRLDVLSSGLLLMTNDGALANKLTHPRYGHDKEYEVRLQEPITKELISELQKGVMLEDGMTQPAVVSQKNATVFAITLKEGRNRQIRRMCETLGFTILSLTRTRTATLRLGDLKSGTWRALTYAELTELKKSAGI